MKKSSVQLTGKGEERSSTGSFGVGDTLCTAGLPSAKVKFEGLRGKHEGANYLADTGIRNAVRRLDGRKVSLPILCYFA